MFQKSVLVSIINNRRDFEIARLQHWYRIPVTSAPNIVKAGRIQYLAFYQTKIFKDEAFSIRWYAPVLGLNIVKRIDLLPNETHHPRKEEDYYKIEFNELIALPKPIISRRWRRIIFIETTPSRLQHAAEINDLFYVSPLEEEFWKMCKEINIDAERQYVIKKNEYTFFLDFAVICKKGKLDIECDGDRYHRSRLYQLERDNKRDNIFQSLGWRIFRLSKNDIYSNRSQTINMVREAINTYNGLEIEGNNATNKVDVSEKNPPQLYLFRKTKR